MQPARNRRSPRQHVPKAHQPPPVARAARQEQDFMLRSAGTPPAFPRELIVTGPQHAIDAPAVRLETALPATSRAPAAPQQARRPKGKKARKAAMRMAAEQARKAASRPTMPSTSAIPSIEPAQTRALPATLPPTAPFARPVNHPEPAMSEIAVASNREEALVASAELRGTAPLEPVSQTLSLALPLAEPAPEPLPEPAPAFLLPSAPEPLVTALPLFAAELPLPRSRSLVPARRQGLVDVIAFLLRDSGRRLARWSARRHKMREEYAQVYAADLRKAALQSQQEALEALRQQQQR